VTYAEAEPELTSLLREFGPPRKFDHPAHRSVLLCWSEIEPA